MTRGLRDTSTLILLGELDPSVLPDEPLVCAIKLAERSAGPLVARDEPERAARQAQRQQAESDFEPIDLDAAAAAAAARASGRVAASLRRGGRKPAAWAFAATTAAGPPSRGLPVVTCHPEDVAGIGDLMVVPVVVPQLWRQEAQDRSFAEIVNACPISSIMTLDAWWPVRPEEYPVR